MMALLKSQYLVEKGLSVVMFYADEVNEGVIFANSSCCNRYQSLLPSREELVMSPLS